MASRELLAFVERSKHLRRRNLLSFEHRKTVTALEPAEADELLDWCEARTTRGLCAGAR